MPCHNKVYNNKDQVLEMLEKQKDLKIPSELIPRCPVCNSEMDTHLRVDHRFVETEEWDKQCDKYYSFINDNQDKNIVLLELGVGFNTPTIIRFPFERLNSRLPKASLIRVNQENFEAAGVLTITNDMKEVFESWSN